MLLLKLGYIGFHPDNSQVLIDVITQFQVDSSSSFLTYQLRIYYMPSSLPFCQCLYWNLEGKIIKKCSLLDINTQ